MRCASLTRGLVSLTVSNGASQPSISVRSSGSIRLPDFDQPGAASGSAMCGGKPSLIRGDARRDVRRLNTSSTAAEHALAGTERMLELAEDEFKAAVVVRALEMPPHRGEFLRRRVLERIDRLLLVADREDRARARRARRRRR